MGDAASNVGGKIANATSSAASTVANATSNAYGAAKEAITGAALGPNANAVVVGLAATFAAVLAGTF